MLESNAKLSGQHFVARTAGLFVQLSQDCKCGISTSHANVDLGDFTTAEMTEIEWTPATHVYIAFAR